jgi:hypothetical protein
MKAKPEETGWESDKTLPSSFFSYGMSDDELYMKAN